MTQIAQQYGALVVQIGQLRVLRQRGIDCCQRRGRAASDALARLDRSAAHAFTA
jgi:hypothetical protein